MKLLGVDAERIGQISRVSIRKAAGSHTIARIDLLAPQGQSLAGLPEMIGKEVELSGEHGVYLYGQLQRVSGSLLLHHTELSLEVISNSAEADRQRLYRVFQSPDTTYKQIAGHLSGTKTAVEIPGGGSLDGRVEVQNGETDFAFLNRLAKEQGFLLFINDTNKYQTVISLVEARNERAESFSAEEMRELAFSVSDAGICISFCSFKYSDAGRLRINGAEYVVVEMCIQAADGVEEYVYKAVQRSERDRQRVPPSHTQVLSAGRGRVVSCSDPDCLGRLQLELLDVEDCVTGNRRWVPYTPNFTETDGGMLLFPAEGEIVNVLCQDGELYAVGCIREKAVLRSGQSPEIVCRHLRLRGGGGAIQLGDEASSSGEEDTVLAMGKDSAQLESRSLRLHSEKQIALEGDTLQLHAEKKAELEGSKLQLSGKQGIDMKT